MDKKEPELSEREAQMKEASLNRSKKMDYDSIIQEVEAKRRKCNMGMIPGIIVGVILIIIGISLYLANPFSPSTFLFFFGIVIVIVSVSIPIAVYQHYFKKNVCEMVVRSVYENAHYEAKPTINPADLRKLELFQVENINAEDLIRASYKGVNFSAVDITSYRVQSNGNHGSNTVVLFDGILLRYDFNKPFEGMIRIIEKEGLVAFSSSRGLKKIEVESIEFNDNYKLYASSDQIAFYVLTPQVIMGLVDLRKKVKGAITIRITSNSIHFAIGGAKNHLEPRALKKFTREDLAKMSKGLEPMKLFVDLLNLDDRHFLEVDRIKREAQKV